MLGRDTEWRQGELLTDEAAQALGLVEGVGSGMRAIVISHDCDLPNETEEFVELIVGVQVGQPSAMLAKARNPRRLHLSFDSEPGAALHVELSHAGKRVVKKADFASIGREGMNFALSADEKRALKQWLAARYGRPAFPNAFERHLRKVVGQKNVEYQIAKILEAAAEHLVGVFFDLGEQRSVELPDGEPYFLSISIAYDAVEGGPAAREAAETVARDLQTLFERAYGAAEVATEIALETCNAVADALMSLADLRKVDQWRVEYISLREEPAGEFLAVGELPP